MTFSQLSRLWIAGDPPMLFLPIAVYIETKDFDTAVATAAGALLFLLLRAALRLPDVPAPETEPKPAAPKAAGGGLVVVAAAAPLRPAYDITPQATRGLLWHVRRFHRLVYDALAPLHLGFWTAPVFMMAGKRLDPWIGEEWCTALYNAGGVSVFLLAFFVVTAFVSEGYWNAGRG